MEENKNTELEEVDVEDDIIELEDDEGNVVNFSWVGTFDYKEETYVVFEPAEPNENFEEGEAVIFRLESDEDGSDLFMPIEDEAKLQEVFDEFIRIYEAEGGCEEGGNCGCGHDSCDCHKS